jgi:hypothetical protein
MTRKKNKNKGFGELLNQSISLKQRIEKKLGLPFFDNLIELVRRRVWYFSDMQAAYYGGVIITGVEERFTLRNIENFSDGHSFTFWFLSKGLSQLDLSRQQKIIGHLQREEYEHEDCTMLAICDLLTAAGGVRGEHYYQSANDMIPLDAGWELLDQVFRSDEFSAIRESLIDKTGE